MKKYVISLLTILLLFSCKEKADPALQAVDWNKEKSTQFNKEVAIEEEIDINLFLAHHATWKMQKTGTGLQFFIYKKGSGEPAQVGMTAQVTSEIRLLDGTVCYQTPPNTYDEFVIDQSEIETGIQEGIKKMRVGDRAKFIIPSHLAHGLVGDMDKVPPLSPIVVDLYLNNLSK
jgi:FKBP-type peptidyl-prolyl cis-trans isomerase